MTVSLAHILKRESEAGTANRLNQDNHDWIFQLRGIHFPAYEEGVGEPRFLGLRTADILVLLGNEKGNVAGVDGTTTAIAPYHYRTIGGEAFYAFPNIGCRGVADGCAGNYGNVSGSIAAFRSDRTVDTASTNCAARLCDGRGTVGLLTATWTPEVQTKDQVTFTAKRSVTLLLGAGSGDRATTASRDESYIGETAAFAPDALFLATFQSAIDTVQRHPIGVSLSNKTYVGLQYTENTFSPLVWLAKRLGVDAGDIASNATIVRLHDYRFREPVNASRAAAREADVDFQIESPKGINVTMSLARLWPGEGIRPVIQRSAWLLGISVSLKL
jgi:hypothetical protein